MSQQGNPREQAPQERHGASNRSIRPLALSIKAKMSTCVLKGDFQTPAQHEPLADIAGTGRQVGAEQSLCLPRHGRGRITCASSSDNRASVANEKGAYAPLVSGKLWDPVGSYIQLRNRLGGIVRLQVQAKVMLPLHAFVHGELELKGGRAAWLDGHRTDDWCRRSTPFQHLHLWNIQNAQRLVADVRDFVGDFGDCIQGLVSQVIRWLLNFDDR